LENLNDGVDLNRAWRIIKILARGSLSFYKMKQELPQQSVAVTSRLTPFSSYCKVFLHPLLEGRVFLYIHCVPRGMKSNESNAVLQRSKYV
jgi:hypothetical protein